MPMTKTGKILKHELRRMHAAGFKNSNDRQQKTDVRGQRIEDD
jgi:acyl-coenzyme A synthetase/AMP-(fatty) acid ligase